MPFNLNILIMTYAVRLNLLHKSFLVGICTLALLSNALCQSKGVTATADENISGYELQVENPESNEVKTCPK